MPTEAVADLELRAAVPTDLPAVAEVYVAARAAAVPAMPAPVRPEAEVRAWVSGWDLSRHETWVATSGGAVVGFASLTGDWLDSLYVLPGHARGGVGSALLGVVMGLRPQGFSLWVFEQNQPARAFYAAHGLLELESTDGSANEERSPDLRVAWPGAEPLAFLRAQIDEVDDDLARLLARRVALTSAVQRHKPVAGQAGRDPEREHAIADRMARHAPALGAARLQRIVHTIITESLEVDAAADGSEGS
ncbi:GNAT family N-acetyltransferase [Nocardioides donggukensis]|uniref:GNAT family N-acetyltransferase n=1 Tax=Nocardioides donggukensis TaxID=2774019 RepID=A0A927K7H7_9ACTN|nr:GNAT family N-acetyltransferase [Nocardioides donggukensis]MBD8869231.1 GNAT family N-acetyltransferase [Nocardioides donggukensis]